MQVKIESTGTLERKMRIELPTERIEREVESRLKRVGKTAKIKGFRPGKVPPKVVRKRYGGQVRQEVLGEIIRTSFSHAVTEKQMNPAGGPAIEPLAAPDDSHFAYRATFEVYPEIELGDLGELEFETPEVTVADDDVDKMIERLRKQRGSWETVERAAADGDRVVVDFLGKVGKEPFEGGEGKDIKIVLGSGQVIPDFEAALVGVTAGEEKTAKVKFPKDYGVETLAGKKATFDITVHGVEELTLPEVDEEFMAAFGVTEGGVEAFRKDVRSNMQRELDQRLRATSKKNVLEALHKAHNFELPTALVQQEAQALQADTMRQMGQDDPTRAPALDNFIPMAEQRVRLSLLVQELIVREQIDLDRDRVEERIQELASPYESPEEAAQLYRSNRDLMTQIESAVLEDHVVDVLIEKGKAKPAPLGFDEFMNMQDSD